ncbi:amino acid permease C-terminal domain-containing protein [Methanogenium organophilum]|uniref:Cationic amino acid transporter C-terminal domain-containing protein n=1 Tax=Methanogenium organophilum TaxID=2199 RepID=A0A9X9S6B7_METOG|nr:amino acid permease C-terminal domain-containing protein [Methanogenium organophilum]WAI02301.1 hypothetical protein OU421_05365 [Methanogenium organophilum]
MVRYSGEGGCPEDPKRRKLYILCIISCAALIAVLPFVTHMRFVIWLVLGIIMYVAYGRSHSILQRMT